MVKKIGSSFAAFLIVTAFLCGGILPAQAQAAFPSETDAFAKTYYLEPINQDAPFFDVVLPEIAANIEENNKHSVTPSMTRCPLPIIRRIFRVWVLLPTPTSTARQLPQRRFTVSQTKV